MRTDCESVEAKVRSIIAEQTGVGEDRDQGGELLVDDLGADSLDIVGAGDAMRRSSTSKSPDEQAENIKGRSGRD